MTQRPLPADTKVDLTNCDREPIHILGNVQGYGCLISTSADLMVNHVSSNCETLLGFDPEAAIGRRMPDLLPEQTVHDLRTKLQISASGSGVARLFGYDVLKTGTLFDISIHISGSSFVFEFEPKAEPRGRDDLSMVQPLIARVRRGETILEAAREAARGLKALSGFDRVMVYRFADDGSGEVIAETCSTGMEPYLGLRYPASDIPQQARALYLRSPLRLIADVNAPVAPILPAESASGEPLDLSLAVTRAVSLIHLEYLRNMGVAASMSVSIIKDGALWGLFACHHRSAHYIDYERRTAIELFAQFFSYELSGLIEARAHADEIAARELHDRLMVRLSSGGDLVDSFDTIAEELGQIVRSDGVAVYSGGKIRMRGATPTGEEFRGLARFLNTAPTGTVYATNNILARYPAAETFGDRAAGLLAVPISRTPRDYIIFFRKEIARSVRWAGNPEKPVEVGPNGIRLTPRKSFDAWNEVVRGTSEPWSDRERRAAEALRVSLIEIVLKLADEANLERQTAAEKQEVLIAELNHRVRNILNLIQGLVSQSKDGASDVASYTSVLDGRIQALARAHDQLTSTDWSACSLRDLIRLEADAYAGTPTGRVEITGDAPLLVPEAFSTLTLVVHELVTNSAKYGALSEPTGQVLIDLRIEEDGTLAIGWTERGGPPVQAPKRRGFGTTIIERTIPFELKGKIETRFKVSGFEADILVPARFVSAADEDTETDTAPAQADDAPVAQLSGNVLVLEDNMVIGLDASDILADAGAEDVRLAASAEEALRLLEEVEVTFAVLDVNLGGHTSLPVAEHLRSKGVPFVLATGYGDVASVLESYPEAPVVKKPFTAESLMREAARAMERD
ncbi:HWE histidine kinase domain-containing protein [Jannaschia marina]|uniref:HWE histidine kinase domain-containing protein n=1 Tax=Jannaschia marina TaxID=2741674 RepID=UPI0015CED26C|nr:HWE histidine kinase domain-containing protein [Jannaschia marina]